MRGDVALATSVRPACLSSLTREGRKELDRLQELFPRSQSNSLRLHRFEMVDAAPVDMEFDENRGGPRHHNNYLSMPESGAFYRATKKIFAWESCGLHDSGRKILPSVYVENVFRKAPVPDPSKLRGGRTC